LERQCETMAEKSKRKAKQEELEEDDDAEEEEVAPRSKKAKQHKDVEAKASSSHKQAATATPAETAKPSALHMLKPKKKGRQHTLSVALPASIVDNAQSWELKAVLVGQIARALTIFSVDEVIVFEDRSGAPQSGDGDGLSRALAFFVRNLQYLETPQYLRRQLLPMHRDLKHVGVLAPLDAPHHLRRNEKLPYREGAVLPKDKAPEKPAGKKGSWVDCGLTEPVWVPGQEIPEDVRVTLKMDWKRHESKTVDEEELDEAEKTLLRGQPVPPRDPTTKLGLYWGYQVRVASSLKSVFEECPFEGGYDMRIGTSERGEAMGVSKIPKFDHLLVVFGGVAGLEEVVSNKQSGYKENLNPAKLFTRYVNICPHQTSRTIRTEEALMITLSRLDPYLPPR